MSFLHYGYQRTEWEGVSGEKKAAGWGGAPGKRARHGRWQGQQPAPTPGGCGIAWRDRSPTSLSKSLPLPPFSSLPSLIPRFLLTPSGRWVNRRLFTNLLISDNDMLSDNSICKWVPVISESPFILAFDGLNAGKGESGSLLADYNTIFLLK